LNNVNALIAIWVLPAVVFALAYFPTVKWLSRGLVSPYPKADVLKRLYAGTIDGLLIATTGVLYWKSDFMLWLGAGAAYVLLRDAMKGQSVGKCFFGLVVVSLETGRPGDRLAQTQVIEGLGAKDLVKSFQDWLASLALGIGRPLGRPRRRPVEW
jgi:hypothetical protein